MSISETTVFLRLSRKLKKEIQVEAKRKHISVNALIRLGISEWLSQEALKHRLEKEPKQG